MKSKLGITPDKPEILILHIPPIHKNIIIHL